jgi:hypothetical protein
MLTKKVIKEYYLPSDAVCMNTALVMRLLEFIKENPTIADVDIHKIVETARKWNEEYSVLNMDAYQSIITGASPT